MFTPRPFRRLRLLIAAAAIAPLQESNAQSRVWRETFSSPQSVQSWRALRGRWVLSGRAYVQTDAAGPGYRFAAPRLPFTADCVEFDATPLRKNDYGFASFGVLISYQDKDNWLAARFGSYGSASLIGRGRGKPVQVVLGPFRAVVGKTYRVAAAWRGPRAAVFLDGALVCEFDRAPASRAGGFFTECPCRFDNFSAAAGPAAWPALKAKLLARRERRRAELAARARASAILSNGVLSDDFSAAALNGWRVVRGHWTVRGSRAAQDSGSWGRYIALAPARFVEGLIETSAAATAKGSFGRGVFGVMVKWIDSANWAALRFGQYGNVSLYARRNGKQAIKGLGPFRAEIGRTYRLRIVVRGGRAAVRCDGKPLGEVEIGFAGRPGRPGLYTEGPAAFDDFRVTGAAPLQGEPSRPRPGAAPALKLEFAAFRPAPAARGVWTPRGNLHLFVRNVGRGDAVLRRVRVFGLAADELPDVVAWVRQRPAALRPGRVGEIAIAFSRLPARAALALFENPQAPAALRAAVEPFAGEPLRVSAQAGRGLPPFQINYAAFDPALRRAFVYVQANPVSQMELHLDKVFVNGADATPRARFGRRPLEGVVPIVIDLPTAPRVGEPVVFAARTREGLWAGRTVRAFPGKFHIQITLLDKQARPDAVEDIWRHAATCIGLCGASAQRLLEAKKFGLDAFHYGGGLALLRRFDRPEYPPIVGCWLDEMDRFPSRRTFDMVQECERAYRREGRFIPLQMVNLCRPRAASALSYYEIGDAACGAYGFHGGKLGDAFGRLSSLPRREYRLARRAFFPYFRDAEIPIPVDPEAHKLLHVTLKHRRCIEPKEERWMTYGCLIQGAKSILHWNYGAGLRRPPNWFSKTHWVIRASLGGALAARPSAYEIPPEVLRALRRTWDEIGRINIELRALGPLIAVSDVSRRARVTRVQPALSPRGGPAAEAAALVSGLDAIVLVVLNQNIRTNWKADAERGVESYEPVDATVELRAPAWLKPKHVFRVQWRGVTALTPAREGSVLRFHFPRLEVSEAVVVTSRGGLQESIARKIAALRERFAQRRK